MSNVFCALDSNPFHLLWSKMVVDSFCCIFQCQELPAADYSLRWVFGAQGGVMSSWWFAQGYPLVNVYITMENHHFQWVNPLQMAIFNSYVKLPEGSLLGDRMNSYLISWQTYSQTNHEQTYCSSKFQAQSSDFSVFLGDSHAQNHRNDTVRWCENGGWSSLFLEKHIDLVNHLAVPPSMNVWQTVESLENTPCFRTRTYRKTSWISQYFS